MSTEHQIQCGLTETTPDNRLLNLRIDGQPVHAELKISHLRRQFLREIPTVLADLLEVAAYVYAADSAIHRGGGVARQVRREWRRRLHFEIPVRAAAMWENPRTKAFLTKVLGFLSEDEYVFEFLSHDGEAVETTNPFLRIWEESWQPDEVLIFSGGLGVAREV